jgi:hypothetical protein
MLDEERKRDEKGRKETTPFLTRFLGFAGKSHCNVMTPT